MDTRTIRAGVAIVGFATALGIASAHAQDKMAAKSAPGRAKSASVTAPSDREIADAIERELLTDHAVPAHRIDVKTAEGIVTLSGTVTDILAKERAGRIAETVKGVRAVVNTLTVDAPKRPDADLARDVHAAMLLDPASDSFEVDVKAANGKVTLGGQVQSWTEKELAARLAKGVRGVESVENNIVVKGTLRPDGEIAADIKQALRWDRYVDDGLLDVTVRDGKATLTGVVGSAAEKTRATQAAWTMGVTEVDTTALEVERWARDDALRTGKYAPKSDAEVARALDDALLRDPRVSAFDVDASVAGGVATLRGTVDNVKAQRAAAATARGTVGVTRVKNFLKVRPSKEMTDAQVNENVRGALGRATLLGDREITVAVSNGIVSLSGAVDSYYEKGQAEDVASRIEGVREVRNNLEVDRDIASAYDPYVWDWYPYDYAWYPYRYPLLVRSDADIREDIESELAWSPFVDANEVTVSVENGVATLTGTVDTWAEYNAARENAYEGGAASVITKLEVDGSA